MVIHYSLTIPFLFLIISFGLSSCSSSNNNTLEINQRKNPTIISSINIESLLSNLINADRKFTPKVVLEDGRQIYRYKKVTGDNDLNLNEIKKRLSLGSDYFERDRANIKILLKKINDLKINNKIVDIESGALGTWTSSKNQILINNKTVKRGSRTFLEVLRHESIHVAQSCYRGSKNSYPKRIGLPLEFSKDLEFNLSHKLYSKNSEEGIALEREAFTYSKVDGAALKLLDKFCL